MTEKTKRSWLRLRFSLGTLLVLILLCALPLAYIAKRRAVNARRWQEIHALTSKGMRFHTDGVATINKDAFSRTWWNALLEDAPAFKRVDLIPSDVPGTPALTADDSDLSRLLFFSEIEEVNIRGARNITDAGLRSLGTLPNLETFSAQNLPLVDGSFLEGFKDAKSLEFLSLTELPALKGEHLKPLSTMRKLRGITMHTCPAVNSRSLHQVDLPAQLTHLYLGETILETRATSALDIGDEVLSKWLTQTKLRSLWVNAPITNKLVPAISKQTSLEALRITNAPLTDADLEFLGTLRRMSDLHLTGLPANGRFLRAFSPRPRLNFLSLKSMPLVEDELRELRRFMLLHKLQLNYTPVEGRFLADLRLPEFYQLDLWGVQFSEEGKANLAKMSRLSSVSYPSNWTALDLRRYSDGAIPNQVTLCSLHRDEVISSGIAAQIHSYYAPWIELDATDFKADAIDRCPPELMAPVIRIHDQARAEGELLKKQRQQVSKQ